jgi:ABC-type multidrug transport system ATPase subunit
MSLEELDLLSYADVRAQNLSGGNKRKLQCSLALLGNPPIMLLDEPSTGVDP